jgi:hypothetical protein
MFDELGEQAQTSPITVSAMPTRTATCYVPSEYMNRMLGLVEIRLLPHAGDFNSGRTPASSQAPLRSLS